MLKYARVLGLNSFINIDQEFYDDVNIITGRNGAGKTTLLKLLWYAISGNLERILPEMSFDEAVIRTDRFELELSCHKRTKSGETLVSARFSDDSAPKLEDTRHSKALRTSQMWEPLNQYVVSQGRGSLFFPTFRRIEGGFSIASPNSEVESPQLGARSYEWHLYRASMGGDGLHAALSELASTLSVRNHKFVSSISTSDIVNLLTSQYASVSSRTNELHRTFATDILERFNRRSQHSEAAEELLRYIAEEAVRIQEAQNRALQPFEVISNLVKELFLSKGIQLTRDLSLGDAASAIASSQLSAGEKQMLSFICYNAFSKQVPIFIDEPEISLHVDWQRRLFPTLLDQQSSNQFIVATHSPFVYSKYEDKEVRLLGDRGDQSNGDA